LSLQELLTSDKKIIMTAGKGGVGKTTCAAAIAVRLAESGKKTLIVSSDPTPSLTDIFEIRIGAAETVLPGLPLLTALEINSEIIIERWKEKFGPEMYEVISSFLPFDEDIIDYVATAPGIEEEYMLDFIIELAEGGRFDAVVWDTAPAGHTLKLLDMPNMFITHLTQAMKVYIGFTDYIKKVQAATKRKAGGRKIVDIIADWEALSAKVVAFMKDKRNTEFVIVTIPEALGVKQSERVIKTLGDYGLAVNKLIVNNVIGESDNEFLSSRRRMQQGYLKHLYEEYAGRLEVLEMPLAPSEVKGLERIRQVSDILFS
jgi:arsenite/tail-anchored protein-transporting ATPase